PASLRARLVFPTPIGPSTTMYLRLSTEDEIRRAEDAKRGPQVVPLERLVHVENRKRHEHRQRDDLLQDLELAQRHLGVADAVARHLDEVFEQRDAPRGQ